MEMFKDNVKLLCGLRQEDLQFYVDLPRNRGMYPRCCVPGVRLFFFFERWRDFLCILLFHGSLLLGCE